MAFGSAASSWSNLAIGRQYIPPVPSFTAVSQRPRPPSRRRVIYPQERCVSSAVLSLAPEDVLEVYRAEGEWWTGRLLLSEGKTPPLRIGLFYSKFTVPMELNKPPAVPSFAMNFGIPPQSAGHPVTYKKKNYISQSPPVDEMNCIICHSLASRPHQTTCCGQTVCPVCAETWKKTNNSESCPQCRQAPLNLSIDVHMERNIANLNVHCSNHTKGCDWVGPLGNVTFHLESRNFFNRCQYVMVKCKRQGCSMELLRCYLQKHMSSECQQRVVQCPCCKVDFCTFSSPDMQTQPVPGNRNGLFATQIHRYPALTYWNLITDHYKECFLWPTRCPNKCPNENLTRGSLPIHLDEDCPEQIISCQFSEAGCGVRVRRREMEEHLQEAMGQHMKDMMRDYLKLKKEHAILMKEHVALKKKHDALITI